VRFEYLAAELCILEIMSSRQHFTPSRLSPLLALACGLGVAVVHAQTQPPTPTQSQIRIYRCGNAYTNDPVEAQAKGCRPLEGGSVTVIEGTRVNNPPPPPVQAVALPAAAASQPASAGAAAPSQRIGANDQRARDADARLILEAELRKAEIRQGELLKEYNNGEPERLGSERNYQRYLDRVAELKAAIARNEADIAGIRRELQRHTAAR
jgi:hypothetical protein